MNSGSVKTNNSKILVLPRLAWLKRRLASLQKCGIVLIGLIFASSVFAQIHYNEEGQVYVCPLATKIEEINPRCDCRIDLILGEIVTSTCPVNGESYEMRLEITEYEGKEYYAILGFENGGAGINFPPIAKISAPSEGYVGQEIFFDGSQSFDQNGDPLEYSWDFGNSEIIRGKKISYIFKNPGDYLINLTVFDGMATSSTTTKVKISAISVSGSKVLEKETPILATPTQSLNLKSEKEKREELGYKFLKKPEEKPQKEETKEETKEEIVILPPQIESKKTQNSFLLASLLKPNLNSFITLSVFVLASFFFIFLVLKKIKRQKK
jgi:energy-coupling factor transporter ATP-binding protein EcfA2